MLDYWRAHGRPARLTMLRAQAAAPEVEIVAAGRDTSASAAERRG